MMTLASPAWFLLLTFVAIAQYFAAGEWERQLWGRGSTGWLCYLKIGFYWGGCGVGLFSLLAMLATDPALVFWMASNGLLMVYLMGAIGTAAWIAWATVKRFNSSATRGFNIVLVSALLTLDYPALKYLQEGVWLCYPEHTLAFGLHMLTFAAVIALTTLTLGYSNLSDLRNRGTMAAFVSHPRVIYTAACIVLDAMWMIMQVDLIRLYPPDFRSVGPGETDLGFAFGSTDDVSVTVLALVMILFSVAVTAYNRRQQLRVQDVLAWNSNRSALPVGHQLMLQNTSLVKKALALTNVAVVTWHAPESDRGIGTDDLRTGTTFISPSPIHNAGLAALGENINLPDFWKAVLHPADYEGAAHALGRALKGEISDFHGQSRFKGEDGAWLTIRGQLEIERSPVNGLPVAAYGIHVNITEEAQANELLGAARVRQLNALRMIGHDLRGALGTVMMAGTLLQRQLKDSADAKVVQNVERIQAAANRALDFLGDAVTYARTEDETSAGEPVTLVVADLLSEIVQRETARYGVPVDKVELKCSPTASLETVLQFPLTSALTNLISNAIKYTPDPAGKVRVSVRSLGAKTRGVEGCTLIEVADEGVGIPPEFAARMFDSFARADNVGTIEGSGLGLAIVANALKLLKAEMTMVSVPEVPCGSVFTLVLPNALVESATDGVRRVASGS